MLLRRHHWPKSLSLFLNVSPVAIFYLTTIIIWVRHWYRNKHWLASLIPKRATTRMKEELPSPKLKPIYIYCGVKGGKDFLLGTLMNSVGVVWRLDTAAIQSALSIWALGKKYWLMERWTQLRQGRKRKGRLKGRKPQRTAWCRSNLYWWANQVLEFKYYVSMKLTSCSGRY